MIVLTKLELTSKNKKHNNLLTPIQSYFNQNCITGIILSRVMTWILIHEINLNMVLVKGHDLIINMAEANHHSKVAFLRRYRMCPFPLLCSVKITLFQGYTLGILHIFMQRILFLDDAFGFVGICVGEFGGLTCLCPKRPYRFGSCASLSSTLWHWAHFSIGIFLPVLISCFEVGALVTMCWKGSPSSWLSFSHL